VSAEFVGSVVTNRRYRRQLLSKPFHGRDGIISYHGCEWNFPAVNSLRAQFAQISDASAIEHSGNGQRWNPALILANKELA